MLIVYLNVGNMNNRAQVVIEFKELTLEYINTFKPIVECVHGENN